jgi:hypothetical protein
MSVRVWSNGSEYDLKDFSLDSRVGLMTGTFDPMHFAHVNVAKASLKSNFGEGGNDLVLFYLQSFSKGKVPVDYSFRVGVIEKMIGNEKDLGLVYFENRFLENPLKSREFVDYVRNDCGLNCSRIIGGDKVGESVKYQSDLLHFVNPREEVLVLPDNFKLLDVNERFSSTQLRKGDVSFGKEYSEFFSEIESHYPFAKIL